MDVRTQGGLRRSLSISTITTATGAATLLVFSCIAYSATSPVLGSAGHRCLPSVCGDVVSALEADGGFEPVIDASGEFKPQVFFFEVPESGAGPGLAVPFTVSVYDFALHNSAGDANDDVCLDDAGDPGECDSASVLRVYPPSSPATPATCATQFVELIAEATPDTPPTGGSVYSNCAFISNDAISVRNLSGDPLTCNQSTPDCCAILDDAILSFDSADLLDLGIEPNCVVPGLWQLEFDTSENTNGEVALLDPPGSAPPAAIPDFNPLFNDIDIYRFTIDQTESTPGVCDEPGEFIRVSAPFVNFATTLSADGPTGTARTVDATLFTNVTGGSAVDFEAGADILQSTAVPFVTGLVTPDQAGQGTFDFVLTTDLPLTSEVVQTQNTGGTPGGTGRIARQGTPFTFLSETNSFGFFQERDGYPFNVFQVDAQGTYGARILAFTTSSVSDRLVTVIAKSTDDAPPVNAPAATPLITNTHLFNFPINASAPFDACSETVPTIADGNEIDEAELTDQFNGGRKPFIFQATRFIKANGTVRCYEHQVRLQNPLGSLGNITIPFVDGNTSTFGIRATVPGASDPEAGGDVRIVAITACDPNAADRNTSGGAGTLRCLNPAEEPCSVTTPSGVETTCDTPLPEGSPVTDAEIDDFDCPSAAELAVQPPTTAAGTLDLRFVPAGPETIVIPPNPPSGANPAVQDPRFDVVVRYIVAVDYGLVTAGEPVYFTGRGTDGTFARWGSETTPDDFNFDPMDFSGLTTLRFPSHGNDVRASSDFMPLFGPPGGGSGSDDSEGGTSTSSDGTNATDASVATVETVRVLRSEESTLVQFETRSEINTGAFDIYEERDEGWVQVGDRLLARPDRNAAVYRALTSISGDEVTLLLKEYEIGGQVREYGPFELHVEPIDVTPEMNGQTQYSFERTKLLEPLNPSLQGQSAAGEAGTRARFDIPTAGIYRIAYSELARVLTASAAELASRASEGRLRVSTRAQTFPYLASAEGIEFWATPFEDEESGGLPFAVSLSQGPRIRERDATPPITAPVPQARARVFFEEDTLPAPATEGFGSSSFWMWRFLLAGSPSDGATQFNFDAPNVIDGPAHVLLRLRGGSAADVYPNHEVIVSLNGEPLLRRGFFGFDSRSEFVEIPSGVLQEAGNVLEITALRRNGVPFSVVWVDGFEITYTQNPRAQNGIARLGGDGEGALSVGGFDTSNVRVWQLDGPRVLELTGLQSGDGSDGVDVVFGNGFARGSEYLAFAPSAVRELTGLVGIRDAEIRLDTTGAEYIVIAHPDLLESATSLADYRKEQGLSTRVIDVLDLYATFTEGRSDPDALARFLRFAYSRWSERPRYVVLVGDGTFDPRNLLGANDNLITPTLFNIGDGRFASDTALGDVDFARGFEIAVGRIPARSAEDVLSYLEKVRAFEADSEGPAANRAFIVADNPDSGGDFADSLELALDVFDRGFFVDSVNVEPDNREAARDQLFAALDTGTRFVHFIGHGGLDGLTADGIFQADDVGTLQNDGSPMLLIAASCLVGRFDVPGVRTLSEALLLDGAAGAAAVYASAGLEVNDRSTELARVVAGVLADRMHRRLGAVLVEASAVAEIAGLPTGSIRLHTLQGDPALMLEPSLPEWRADVPPLLLPSPIQPETPPNHPPADEPSAPLPSPETRRPRTSNCSATSPSLLWLLFVGFLVRHRTQNRARG